MSPSASRSIATARTALMPPRSDCLPEEHATRDSERVDCDIDRRPHPAGDERLVELVADGVQRPDREREAAPSRRSHERSEDCVLGRSGRACEGRGPNHRARPQIGIEESAKISAAQARTGSQSRAKVPVTVR